MATGDISPKLSSRIRKATAGFQLAIYPQAGMWLKPFLGGSPGQSPVWQSNGTVAWGTPTAGQLYSSIIAPTGNTNLAIYELVKLTTDALTHTLPTAPANGSWIEFQSGNVTNVVIQRGGTDTIVGSANPLQVDKPYAGAFRLVYNSGNWEFSGGG